MNLEKEKDTITYEEVLVNWKYYKVKTIRTKDDIKKAINLEKSLKKNKKEV